jgi:hypothetical protein
MSLSVPFARVVALLGVFPAWPLVSQMVECEAAACESLGTWSDLRGRAVEKGTLT